MTALRWYGVDQVTEGARLLRQRLDTGSAGWLEFCLAAGQFILRSEGGEYWFLNPISGNWQCYRQQGWHPDESPAGWLEGAAALETSGVLPTGLYETVGDPFSAKETWQPAEVLQALVRQAVQNYRAGRSSTTEVELLLGRLFLMDRQGRFWSVGFQSQQWYRYAEADWISVEHGPDPAQLVRWRGGRVKCSQCGAEAVDTYLCPSCGVPLIPGLDQLDEIALQRFYRFLVTGAGSLPEPVSSPWEPPSELPRLERELQCEVCGARGLPGSRYCSHCGASLGCPRCGATNPPDSRFCNTCGQTLTGEGSRS